MLLRGLGCRRELERGTVTEGMGGCCGRVELAQLFLTDRNMFCETSGRSTKCRTSGRTHLTNRSETVIEFTIEYHLPNSGPG